MDRRHLVQVFQNLIENAIQYSPSGGCVVVEAEEGWLDGRAWVSYAIQDSGPGFPPEDLARVFEPFFSRRRSGTSLGLAIVQRIVEGHGGNINAGNRHEGGAVIVVRFPLIQPSLSVEYNQEGHHASAQDLSG